MKRLKGIVPVLISPVNDDGAPDEQGYHKLIDFTLRSPIAGYWTLGSASEDFVMTYDDRVHIAQIVAEHVNGAVPIVAGCGSPSVAETLRFFDATAEMRIDAYHLLPTDRRMQPRPTYEYCKMIADRSPKPVWLYNNGMRGLQIPVSVVADLKDHPNIVGIKAAGFDLSDIIPFCTMDSETFQTIGSGGSHILLFLAMGCDAHTVSLACCFPKMFCDVYELWQAGEIAGAREASFAINRLFKSLPRIDNTELCAEEKAILDVMGICKRHVYKPFRPFTDQQVEQARVVLSEAGIV